MEIISAYPAYLKATHSNDSLVHSGGACNALPTSIQTKAYLSIHEPWVKRIRRFGQW